MTRSDFEERQEDRKDRLKKRAEKAQDAAQAANAASDRIAKAIPMGQPILVGHHSERRHRADMKRIDRGMRKFIAEVWKGVGEEAHLEPTDLNQLRLDMARRWTWQPGAPFPTYALSNLSAELRRVRARIEALRQAAARPPTQADHGVCRVVENVGENRIQLLFDGKPKEATRTLLKQWGFRWSPMASAWQRQLNDAGRIAARSVVEALRKEVPHGNP